jgi:hypothetical protein
LGLINAVGFVESISIAQTLADSLRRTWRYSKPDFGAMLA